MSTYSVLDKAEYSAFQSTLNSPIVSYRIKLGPPPTQQWSWPQGTYLFFTPVTYILKPLHN